MSKTPSRREKRRSCGTAPDSDVIKRAQEGDADAFAALFHAHKARIYSVCLRMTTNAAEAEDRTQEAV
jgi:RNA polymerase sigma-70 factor (ECF subfamily)